VSEGGVNRAELEAALDRMLADWPCDRTVVWQDPAWDPSPAELAAADQAMAAALAALRGVAPEVGGDGDDEGA
jgi:hypothetical protein